MAIQLYYSNKTAIGQRTINGHTWLSLSDLCYSLDLDYTLTLNQLLDYEQYQNWLLFIDCNHYVSLSLYDTFLSDYYYGVFTDKNSVSIDKLVAANLVNPKFENGDINKSTFFSREEMSNIKSLI